MTAERNTECRYLLAFMAPLSNRNFGDVIEKFEELLEGGRGEGEIGLKRVITTGRLELEP